MILFSIFASIALVSAIMVIRVKNPVHSVLFLILVFCNASANILLLGLDFFAMILIIVYVGAIAVLFLFVVMMLNIKIAEIHENVLRYLPVGAVIGFILLLELFAALTGHTPFDVQAFSCKQHFFVGAQKTQQLSFCEPALLAEGQVAILPLIDPLQNIETLGLLVYTTYAFYFFLGGLILFVAMIGAIVLTMRKKTVSRKQSFYLQSVKASLVQNLYRGSDGTEIEGFSSNKAA
jgi:NADH:ubiquinone oxidoreductase subunit 6 (subunit J)